MSTTALPTTPVQPTNGRPTTGVPSAGTSHTHPAATELARLARRIDGDVLVPGDDAYELHRLAWNRSMVHTPAVVVVAADAADVAAAVAFAADHGLGVGVQATGHGGVVPVDGLLLDTSRLTDVIVEPDRRTAWVGAGCTWAPVLAATQEHGLAPLLGSSSGVGAVGYTLGGGLGWLARRFGAACDTVRSFEVVTADGRLLRATADEHRDLFVALRGGGGGAFGIVTGMEIDLVPVTTVYAGDLLYPAEAAADVVERYAAWVVGTPEALTSSVVFMNFPPFPEIPEPLRGRSFIIVRGCWSGEPAEGRRVIDEWRTLLPPIADTWGELPFARCDAISQDPTDPMPAVTTGGWLTGLDRSVGEVLAAATFPSGGPPALAFSEIRHVGGAMARADRALSAMGHRDRSFVFHAVGVPEAHAPEAIAAHQARMKADLGAALADGVYLNFTEGAERRARSLDGIDARFRTGLAELQRRIDPTDTFRYGVHHTGGAR